MINAEHNSPFERGVWLVDGEDGAGEPTCVSVTVAVLGARGLDREMVYMMSRV